MRRLAILTLALSLTSALWANDPPVPRPAGEFAIFTTNNTQDLLTKYRGKVVMLMFIFTTCPHCQQLCQTVTRLNSEYGPRGIQPLAVAFNDGAGNLVNDFVRTYRPNFPVGFAPRESVLDYLQYTSTQRLTVPQIVFIDRKGTIRAQTKIDNADRMGEEPTLRKQIESLLAEGAISSAAKTSAAKKTTPKK